MMLSIIICSRTKDLSHELRDNINQTIGVDYELIVIDNSLCNKSIFQAYNEGIEKSQGEILVFMHDDVKLCSSNWGGGGGYLNILITMKNLV